MDPNKSHTIERATLGQEHTRNITDLTSRIKELELQLSQSRTSGGSERLSRLPGEALALASKIFESIPIPDVQQFYRSNQLGLLATKLKELDSSGLALKYDASMVGDLDEVKQMLVAKEGEGNATYEATLAVISWMSKFAGDTLVDLMASQAEVSPTLSAARTAFLTEAGSTVDLRAQYKVQTKEGRSSLFGSVVDQLLNNKDQTFTLQQQASQLQQDLLILAKEKGIEIGTTATARGIVNVIKDSASQLDPTHLGEKLYDRFFEYVPLVPCKPGLQTVSEIIASSNYTQVYSSGLTPKSDPLVLAKALDSVLELHEKLLEVGSKTKIKKLIACKVAVLKPKARPPNHKKIMSDLSSKRSLIDHTKKQVEKAQKRLSLDLASPIKAYIGLKLSHNEDPKSAKIRIADLDKTALRAFHSDCVAEAIERAEYLLCDPECGLDAIGDLVHQKRMKLNGASNNYQIERLDRLISSLEAGLENGGQEEDSLDLNTSYLTEGSVLAARFAEIKVQTENFLGPYSRSKIKTVEEAKSKLEALCQQEKGFLAPAKDLVKSANKKLMSTKKAIEFQLAKAKRIVNLEDELQKDVEIYNFRTNKFFDKIKKQLTLNGVKARNFAELVEYVARTRQGLTELRQLDSQYGESRKELDLIFACFSDCQNWNRQNMRETISTLKLMSKDVRTAQLDLTRLQNIYLQSANEILVNSSTSYLDAQSTVDEVARGLDAISDFENRIELYAKITNERTAVTIKRVIRAERSKLATYIGAVEKSRATVAKVASRLSKRY